MAAATGVGARSAYAITPVPALAYAVAADARRLALTVNAAQWIANAFIAMTASTSLAVLIAAAQWLLSLRKAR